MCCFALWGIPVTRVSDVLKGEGFIWYSREIDLFPPSHRDHPSGGGEPYLPVAGAGKLSQKVEFPLSYKLTSPPFIFIAMVTAMLWGGATQNYEETKVKGDFF